jgi:ABC-type transport system substrate-binding protein
MMLTHIRQLGRALMAACAAASLFAGGEAALAQPAEPKVLHIPRTIQFDSLDPVKGFETAGSEIVLMVYDSLLTYSYLERPYKLAPRLVTAMPELGADKLTYTFELRRGVRFHDDPCFPGGKGRELTTDDVLYSLKRYADGRLNPKSWFAMEGAVAGLDAYRAETLKPGAPTDYGKLEVAGIKKLDAYRFSIKLTHENPLFLYALAISATVIVPVEAVQFYKERFETHTVGTGPFILKDVERKGTLRFVKNPSYFGVYPSTGAPGDAEKGLLKDAGKRLPLVDVVEMPLIEEAQPAALKFLAGELDQRGLDRANFTKLVVRGPGNTFRLADAFAGKFDIYWTPGLNMTYYGLNMKDPLLGQNKALRQALAHGVDVQGQIDVLLNGRGHALASVVPTELPGSERETGATPRTYDPAAAKALLAQAGYPGGKGLAPITVLIGGASTDERQAFDFLKSRMAAIGVTLKAEFLDTPTFVRRLESGNSQMFSYGWVADYPDAEDFYLLLYSKNVAPGPNSGSFKSPEYDRAYEASRFMAHGPERLKHFKIMNEVVREEVPMILDINPLRFGITQKWMSNFKRNLLTPEYPFVDVDMARKKKGP